MMKYTTTHHHLTLSLVLLISISISISGATGENSPVVDTDGNEVKAGLEYTLVASILTSSFGFGGLSLDSSCPFPTVIQDTSDRVGLPVVFQSKNGSDEVIRTSSELTIEFSSAPTTCDDVPTKWGLMFDLQLRRSVVKVGLVRQGYFKLKEVLPSAYFLSCADKDIRFPRDDFLSSKRHLVAESPLAIADIPFLVSITRATSTTNNNFIIRNPTSS